jgi:hypothetical protein
MTGEFLIQNLSLIKIMIEKGGLQNKTDHKMKKARSMRGYKIYIHNLSDFDVIYFIYILASLDNCIFKTIIKEGKNINIQLNFNK